MIYQIGFMQGRLSPLIDGKIQAFPWGYWESEFSLAHQINIHMMEWTLDKEHLYENPLLTEIGQKKIILLSDKYNISIPSLTGDCFMQKPIWKVFVNERDELESDFVEIVKGCAAIGIKIIVVPLVDNGRLENRKQENNLIDFFKNQLNYLRKYDVKIAFESDYTPTELARFISRLDPSTFGINYDIGNSAAFGFEPKIEFEAYGARILNVHIKDRLLGGSTVALGDGNANFDDVFGLLRDIKYQGNFILQTARASDNKHIESISKYRDMTLTWLNCNAT